MRIYEHKVQLGNEPFTISSYDYEKLPETISGCAPIRVHVRQCDNFDNAPVELTEIVQLDVADGDFSRLFRAHCDDILEGEFRDLRPVRIQIYANRMVLEFFSVFEQAVKTAILSLAASQVMTLDLQLEVPSLNRVRGRVGYEISVKHRSAMIGYPPQVTTVITERLPDGRYSVFKLCSAAPREMIISEGIR